MLLGAALMVAANAASVLGAGAVLRKLRREASASDVPLFLALRLLLISGVVLLAGLASALAPLPLGALGVVALAALLACGEHRRLPEFRWPQWGGILAAAYGLVAVRLLLQVWFFAPHLGDPLAYHLPKVAEWIRAAGFTREMGVHPHASFPAGFELIETWWVVFLHHDVLIEMAGVEFLVLGAAATHSLAVQSGLTARAASYAALIYLLVPGMHLGATSCLNDTPAAALFLATACLILGRVPLPVVVSVFGMGLGVKPTYGFAAAGLALLWFLTPRGRESAGRMGFAVAAAGLAAGGFWYARNWVWFGNPFYPLGSPGFVDPTPVQFGPSLASLIDNIANLVNVRIYDDRAIYSANVDDMSGWGGVAFSCGGPAIIVGLMEDRTLRRLGAAFGAALAGSFLFIQNDPWCLKYVFYAPAILAIATARLADRSRGIMAVSAVALAFAFAGTFFPYDLPPSHVWILARQPWRQRTAAPLAYGRAEMPVSESSVGYFGSPVGPAYLLYGPEYGRRVEYLRARTAEQLIASVDRSGIDVVYAAPESDAERKILEETVGRGRLQFLQGRFFRVVR